MTHEQKRHGIINNVQIRNATEKVQERDGDFAVWLPHALLSRTLVLRRFEPALSPSRGSKVSVEVLYGAACASPGTGVEVSSRDRFELTSMLGRGSSEKRCTPMAVAGTGEDVEVPC